MELSIFGCGIIIYHYISLCCADSPTSHDYPSTPCIYVSPTVRRPPAPPQCNTVPPPPEGVGFVSVECSTPGGGKLESFCGAKGKAKIQEPNPSLNPPSTIRVTPLQAPCSSTSFLGTNLPPGTGYSWQRQFPLSLPPNSTLESPTPSFNSKGLQKEGKRVASRFLLPLSGKRGDQPISRQPRPESGWRRSLASISAPRSSRSRGRCLVSFQGSLVQQCLVAVVLDLDVSPSVKQQPDRGLLSAQRSASYLQRRQFRGPWLRYRPLGRGTVRLWHGALCKQHGAALCRTLRLMQTVF